MLMRRTESRTEDFRGAPLVVLMVIVPSGGLPLVDSHKHHLRSGIFSYMRQKLFAAEQRADILLFHPVTQKD